MEEDHRYTKKTISLIIKIRVSLHRMDLKFNLSQQLLEIKALIPFNYNRHL